MNLKRQYVLIALILFSSISAFSQVISGQGTLALLNGDSIQGYIEIHSPSRVNLSSSFSDTTYDISQTKGFVISEASYETRAIKQDSSVQLKILEVLYSCEETLFYAPFEEETSYYLESMSHGLVLLENKGITVYKEGIKYVQNSRNYIGRLKFIWNDTPDIYAKIDRSPFTDKALISLAKEHQNLVSKDNSCEDNSKKRSIKIGLSVFVGIQKPWMKKNLPLDDRTYKYYYLRNNDFQGSVKPEFGVTLKLYAPSNDLFFFQYSPSLSFQKISSQHVYTDEYNHLEYRSKVQLEQLALNQNLQFAMRMYHRSFNAYALVGTFHRLFLNQSYSRETVEYSQISESIRSETFSDQNIFNNSESGPSLGLKIQKNLQKHLIGIDMRYMLGFGFFNNMRTNNLLVNLSYEF